MYIGPASVFVLYLDLTSGFVRLFLRCIWSPLIGLPAINSRNWKLELQYPWMLRSPKISLGYARALRDRPSVEHISHLISSKCAIFDHFLSQPWSHLRKQHLSIDQVSNLFFLCKILSVLSLFATLITSYFHRIPLLNLD